MSQASMDHLPVASESSGQQCLSSGQGTAQVKQSSDSKSGSASMA